MQGEKNQKGLFVFLENKTMHLSMSYISQIIFKKKTYMNIYTHLADIALNLN